MGLIVGGEVGGAVMACKAWFLSAIDFQQGGKSTAPLVVYSKPAMMFSAEKNTGVHDTCRC